MLCLFDYALLCSLSGWASVALLCSLFDYALLCWASGCLNVLGFRYPDSSGQYDFLSETPREGTADTHKEGLSASRSLCLSPLSVSVSVSVSVSQPLIRSSPLCIILVVMMRSKELKTPRFVLMLSLSMILSQPLTLSQPLALSVSAALSQPESQPVSQPESQPESQPVSPLGLVLKKMIYLVPPSTVSCDTTINSSNQWTHKSTTEKCTLHFRCPLLLCYFVVLF